MIPEDGFVDEALVHIACEQNIFPTTSPKTKRKRFLKVHETFMQIYEEAEGDSSQINSVRETYSASALQKRWEQLQVITKTVPDQFVCIGTIPVVTSATTASVAAAGSSSTSASSPVVSSPIIRVTTPPFYSTRNNNLNPQNSFGTTSTSTSSRAPSAAAASSSTSPRKNSPPEQGGRVRLGAGSPTFPNAAVAPAGGPAAANMTAKEQYSSTGAARARVEREVHAVGCSGGGGSSGSSSSSSSTTTAGGKKYNTNNYPPNKPPPLVANKGAEPMTQAEFLDANAYDITPALGSARSSNPSSSKEIVHRCTSPSSSTTTRGLDTSSSSAASSSSSSSSSSSAPAGEGENITESKKGTSSSSSSPGGRREDASTIPRTPPTPPLPETNIKLSHLANNNINRDHRDKALHQQSAQQLGTTTTSKILTRNKTRRRRKSSAARTQLLQQNPGSHLSSLNSSAVLESSDEDGEIKPLDMSEVKASIGRAMRHKQGIVGGSYGTSSSPEDGDDGDGGVYNHPHGGGHSSVGSEDAGYTREAESPDHFNSSSSSSASGSESVDQRKPVLFRPLARGGNKSPASAAGGPPLPGGMGTANKRVNNKQAATTLREVSVTTVKPQKRASLSTSDATDTSYGVYPGPSPGVASFRTGCNSGHYLGGKSSQVSVSSRRSQASSSFVTVASPGGENSSSPLLRTAGPGLDGSRSSGVLSEVTRSENDNGGTTTTKNDAALLRPSGTSSACSSKPPRLTGRESIESMSSCLSRDEEMDGNDEDGVERASVVDITGSAKANAAADDHVELDADHSGVTGCKNTPTTSGPGGNTTTSLQVQQSPAAGSSISSSASTRSAQLPGRPPTLPTKKNSSAATKSAPSAKLRTSESATSGTQDDEHQVSPILSGGGCTSSASNSTCSVPSPTGATASKQHQQQFRKQNVPTFTAPAAGARPAASLTSSLLSHAASSSASMSAGTTAAGNKIDLVNTQPVMFPGTTAGNSKLSGATSTASRGAASGHSSSGSQSYSSGREDVVMRGNNSNHGAGGGGVNSSFSSRFSSDGAPRGGGTKSNTSKASSSFKNRRANLLDSLNTSDEDDDDDSHPAFSSSNEGGGNSSTTSGAAMVVGGSSGATSSTAHQQHPFAWVKTAGLTGGCNHLAGAVPSSKPGGTSKSHQVHPGTSGSLSSSGRAVNYSNFNHAVMSTGTTPADRLHAMQSRQSQTHAVKVILEKKSYQEQLLRLKHNVDKVSNEDDWNDLTEVERDFSTKLGYQFLSVTGGAASATTAGAGATAAPSGGAPAGPQSGQQGNKNPIGKAVFHLLSVLITQSDMYARNVDQDWNPDRFNVHRACMKARITYYDEIIRNYLNGGSAAG
ncbi:unnamed protein product [Amoebophrya sp. A120]|nr:unnamed protein product [Amoebophrya sp. A120]|eukprot:GSA120T00019181001.1